MSTRYPSMPVNSVEDARQAAREEVRIMLGQTARIGDYAPNSIPGYAVLRPLVTELPVAPQDGEEIDYLADSTNSRVWHFRYRAKAPTLFRWESVGVPTPLRATNVGTSMAAPATNYGDPSTPGPILTIPLAGDYVVQHWFQGQGNTVGALLWAAVKIGSAATVDGNGVRGQVPVANHDVKAPVCVQELTVSLPGTVLQVQYKLTAGTGTINNHGGINPWMTATPVRVGRT